MLILVTYDVSTETSAGRRRLRYAAKICLNYGQRVQKSVFECKVKQAGFEELQRQLLPIIDEAEDSLVSLVGDVGASPSSRPRT